MNLLKLFAAVMTAAAAAMDLRSGKVPNLWFLLTLLGGIVLRFISKEGFRSQTAAGILLPLVLLFPLFYLQMLGAGDIKLFCALGCVLGMKILPCMVFSFLIGGVFSAVVLLLHRGLLRERLLYLQTYVRAVKKGIRPPAYRQGGTDRPENFPFTAAILGSVLLYFGGVY